MGLHRRQLHMLTYSDEEHAKTDEKAGIDKNACRLEIAGKREKAVFKSKLFITGYFVCYERFFRTRSYKSIHFYKIFNPPQKMLKSAHDDFSRLAKFSVEYELYSLPKQDFRPILCFILMESS
jgi:hypothetical protein